MNTSPARVDTTTVVIRALVFFGRFPRRSPEKLSAIADEPGMTCWQIQPCLIMKKTLLLTVIGLTSICGVFAQESATLSITGPSSWVPGTMITLSVQDTYANLGGSFGFSDWLLVNSSVAPFVSITDLVHITFPNGYTGPYPILFNLTGSEPNFTGDAVDLGGSTSGGLIPDGSYPVTEITFALGAGAPAGTYMLHTSTILPRASEQTDSNFFDVLFPQASFVFTVVPEPSTLALLGIGAVASACFINRRRKRFCDASKPGAVGASSHTTNPVYENELHFH